MVPSKFREAPVILTKKPAVEAAVLGVPLLAHSEPADAYPVVVTEPAPSWIKMSEVPFVLTPLNITVMRLTQDGMLVKSMAVPEVDATDVPEVMTLAPMTGVPLIVGLLIVGLVKIGRAHV